MNYKDAEILFAKKDKGKKFPIIKEDQIEKNTVQLEKNMTLEKVNKSFIINLYSTHIITLLPNGLYRLSTNGKMTNLTKSRLEKYSPVKIRIADGWWWIVDKKEKILSLYYERVLINKNGKVIVKISEKSIIFKRLVLILSQIINKTSDNKIYDILYEHHIENEINNLRELLGSSSKDIKSIYYSSNDHITKNMDQLIYDMLKFGNINNYNEYIEIKNNIFKSKEKLLKIYFIPFIINNLKFVLKTKERETINA